MVDILQRYWRQLSLILATLLLIGILVTVVSPQVTQRLLVLVGLGYWSLSDHWEHWSYFATTLGLLGVLINAALLWTVFIQIRQGQKTFQENVRARIDDKAPRVVALMGRPIIHGEVVGKAVTPLPENPEYVMPKMQDREINLIVTGTLVNEGASSAVVRLDGNGTDFLEGAEKDDPVFDSKVVSSLQERILRPGQSVRFVWSEGHTVKDWVDAFTDSDPPNPHSACFMTVSIRDYFEDGVLDCIPIEMAARPLASVKGDNGRWQLNEENTIGITTYPLMRAYRKEGWRGFTLPWEKIYKARPQRY